MHKHVISLAIHVSDILNQVVGYVTIISGSSSVDRIDLFLKIFVTLIFTVYEYLDVYLDNPKIT
jgi:hypothetical protein